MSNYPPELRDAAIRRVFASVPGHNSQWAAIEEVAATMGIGSPETLRKWVRRAEVDAGERPGVTSTEATENRRLRRKNSELRRSNEILIAASDFFEAELDRPSLSS